MEALVMVDGHIQSHLSAKHKLPKHFDLPKRVQSCKQDFVFFRVWKKLLTFTSSNRWSSFILNMKFHLIRYDAVRV